MGCDFIFIQTDNVKLISRLSSLRPLAYLIVFTDKPEVKGAVAVNFGVYCYKSGEDLKPVNFFKNHGSNYGYESFDKVRVLVLETENQKIVSSRIH